MAACPLCGARKGKRACPAKGADICPHCCGTKRLVEVACPEDCVYLKGEHATSWEGRETERKRDARRLGPHLASLTDEQARLLPVAFVGVHGIRSRRGDLDDALLAQAVGALRKTVETRMRGVLYEHPAEDLRAQGLVSELRGLFEAKDESGGGVTPADRDLLPVLAALEAAIEDTRKEGASPTAFLETAARVVGLPAVPPRSRPLIVTP
jgi:hypothetical protein